MKRLRLRLVNTQPSALDQLIDRYEAAMMDLEPSNENYPLMADQLTKLYKIKKDEKSPRRVDANTLAIIAGNLAGILLVINAERLHVIAGKAATLGLRTVTK